MKSKCLFILVLITGIFFVMSALEINTDSIKNTFDDEYDHYIQPDNTHVHATIIEFAQNYLPLLIIGGFETYFFSKMFSSQHCPLNNFVFNIKYPPKIYLLQRLLKI